MSGVKKIERKAKPKSKSIGDKTKQVWISLKSIVANTKKTRQRPKCYCQKNKNKWNPLFLVPNTKNKLTPKQKQ